MNNRVILSEEDIDLRELRENMIYDDTDSLVTFTEQAQNERKGAEVISVEIEAYKSITRNSMQKVKDLIQKRFDINNIVIIQRVGKFEPGENIREFLISAPEKGEALEASAMALDIFEPHVPLKKKVATLDGRKYWVKRADEVMNMYGQLASEI